MEFHALTLDASVAEGVNRQAFVEGIEGADENDEGGIQRVIVAAFFKESHVDHALVVPRPLGELLIAAIGALHFDIIYAATIIFYIDIEPDALAVVANGNIFLCIRECDFLDGNMKDFLDEVLADSFVLHDFLK